MQDFPVKSQQTRQQLLMSSVELQTVFLVYAMYRIFAIVKSTTQIKNIF